MSNQEVFVPPSSSVSNIFFSGAVLVTVGVFLVLLVVMWQRLSKSSPSTSIVFKNVNQFPNQSTLLNTNTEGKAFMQSSVLFPPVLFPNTAFAFTPGKLYLITGFATVFTDNVNSTVMQLYLTTEDDVTLQNYTAKRTFQLYEHNEPGSQPRFGTPFSVVFQATTSSTTYGLFLYQTCSANNPRTGGQAYLTDFKITQLK